MEKELSLEAINTLLGELISSTEIVMAEVVDAISSNDDEKAEVAFKGLLDIKTIVQRLNRVDWPFNSLSENNNVLEIKKQLFFSCKAILHSGNPKKLFWVNRIVEVSTKLTADVGK